MDLQEYEELSKRNVGNWATDVYWKYSLTARRARLHSSSLLIVQQVAVDLVDETTTSELGRVMSITTKQFTTDKHQHQPAGSIGACRLSSKLRQMC